LYRSITAFASDAPNVLLDARIIASTNRDLRREVTEGRFREDLLVDHLVRRLNGKLGTGFVSVEPEALRALAAQPWKGNVRELENVLERAMVLGSGEQLLRRHLTLEPTACAAPASSLGLREAVRQFELQYVRDVLSRAGDDKQEVAPMLEMSLASLYRNLDIDDESPPC
jgi:DNA-binding NtrC family response regulator